MVVGRSLRTFSSQSDADHFRELCPAAQASCRVRALPSRTTPSNVASRMHLAIIAADPLTAPTDMLDEFWSPHSPDEFVSNIPKSPGSSVGPYSLSPSRYRSGELETTIAVIVLLLASPVHLRRSRIFKLTTSFAAVSSTHQFEAKYYQ